MIVINDLTKIYDNDVIALENINLKVNPGITAIIGPNGSGKSTLLNILIGFLKPTSGDAKVFSLDSWDQSVNIRKKIGILQEDKYFPSHMKVNMFLSLIKNFFQTSFESNIEDYVDIPRYRRIGTLSSGMNRKLGILQAFIGNPQLVLLDEPTANLDPMARSELISFIRILNEKFNISFLIASHIISDLEQIAKQFIILNEGNVVFNGTFPELIEKFESNIFEIHGNDLGKWIKKIQSNKHIEKITQYQNIYYIKTTNKFTSMEFFDMFINTDSSLIDDFVLFRKFLDIKKIFLSPLLPDND